MGTIFVIIKDGIKAFIVWFVLTAIVIVLTGPTIGRALAGLLGTIFLVCFCIVTIGRIFGIFTRIGRGGAPPKWKPPASSPPLPPAPPMQQQYCPKCGAEWITGAQRCASCDSRDAATQGWRGTYFGATLALSTGGVSL
jgi:hypothetical protein